MSGPFLPGERGIARLGECGMGGGGTGRRVFSRQRFDNVGRVGTIARDHSFNNGLIMRAVRDSLILSPPLTLSHEEAEELAATAKKTLDDTWKTLKADGLV